MHVHTWRGTPNKRYLIRPSLNLHHKFGFESTWDLGPLIQRRKIDHEKMEGNKNICDDSDQQHQLLLFEIANEEEEMMVASIPISSSSSLASPPNPNINPRISCSVSLGFRRSPSRRSIKIECTATKQAKSAAEEEWKVKREVLLQKRVRSVDVKEALRLQKENNFVILDVRPEAEFKEGHPPGAINVQIYRLIKEWTAWDIARRVAFAFFGIFSGTEENPEFLESVQSKLDKDSKIIVACASGGTMKPSQSLPEGQQSRSLIAAYLLVLNGYTNVYHLEGGLYQWFKEELPVDAEE